MHNAIIFLDIDGVLNSMQTANYRHKQYIKGKISDSNFDDACHICLSNLETILESVPDLKVVISSSWRLGQTLEGMKNIFRKWGFEYIDSIIGLTPSSKDHYRGLEIKAWLDKNPTKNFVVLDDEINDIVPIIDRSRVVKTSFSTGITWDHTAKAIKILGGKELQEFF
jgi:hypothetical protein